MFAEHNIAAAVVSDKFGASSTRAGATHCTGNDVRLEEGNEKHGNLKRRLKGKSWSAGWVTLFFTSNFLRDLCLQSASARGYLVDLKSFGAKM